MRQSASIRFDLPSKVLTSEPQSSMVANIVDTASAANLEVFVSSIDDTADIAVADPPTKHPGRAHPTSTTSFIASTTISTPLLNTPSQRPHPVMPRHIVTSTPKTKISNRPFPHLTLSAYKRPKEMVRLTEANPTRLLEQEYNLKGPGCKVIGHGAYSTVRSALNQHGETVAIKSISKFDAIRARRLRRPGSKHMDEWEIMKLLQTNPYTLTLLDLLETDDEIHLVTEYCEGGELFNAIKRKGISRCSFRRGRFSEQQASRITFQLLKALEGMHHHGIVHRDIKPENVLILKREDEFSSYDNIQIKLADFGVARVHHHHQQQGNPANVSETVSSDGESSPSTPGLLLADKADPPPEGCRGSCGPASDMFSLGVTLYILLCGFPPVFCEHVVQFPEAYWQDISDEAKELVRKMLRKEAEQRISAVDALRHRWIGHEQTSRGRRGSICANLELVRSRLAETLEATLASEGASTMVQSNAKRTSRTSIHLCTSPKRTKRSAVQLPMTDLYKCQEKQHVRVNVEQRVEAAAVALDDAVDRIIVKVMCT
jgi:serine/threonine protein kinase